MQQKQNNSKPFHQNNLILDWGGGDGVSMVGLGILVNADRCSSVLHIPERDPASLYIPGRDPASL